MPERWFPATTLLRLARRGVGSDYGAVEGGVNLLAVGTACSAAALRSVYVRYGPAAAMVPSKRVHPVSAAEGRVYSDGRSGRAYAMTI